MKLKKHFLFISLLFFSSIFVSCNSVANIEEEVINNATHNNIELNEDMDKEEISDDLNMLANSANDTDKDSTDEKAAINKKEKLKSEKITVDKKSEKEEKEEEPKVAKASGTFYVTAEWLNVRSGDGTSYEIIGGLPLNAEVNVTGKTENGWYAFDYDGKVGFVSGNYLSTEKQEVKSKQKDNVVKENEVNTDKKDNKNNDDDEKRKEKSNKANTGQNKNVADKMKSLGNSRQVILVTTKGYNTSKGQIRTFEKDSDGKWNEVLSATAYIGKNGFADNKVEGDGKTPTGKYTLGHAFGYKGNPGTKLSFKHSTDKDVWVDDPNSKYYNTWQTVDKKDKDWKSAESMMHRLYTYGVVINYNTQQVPNKGSAIFMHVGNSHTLGCVAMSQDVLIKIMKWVDPGKNPVIILIPESKLSNY